MKATLEFDLPEDTEEHELALKAGRMSIALWEVRNSVFRPARKHGYSHSGLTELSKRDLDVIRMLEEIFNEILIDNEVDS